jgi:hypothetical protein
MERGLIWLPLLAIFVGLAWAGWHEYQKVQAYGRWAKNFQRAKYDLYAVLGQADRQLTWGKPTPRGPIDLQTLCLDQIQSVKVSLKQQSLKQQSLKQQSLTLLVAEQILQSNQPVSGQVALELTLAPPEPSSDLSNLAKVNIPFTDLALALEWARWLEQNISLVCSSKE